MLNSLLKQLRKSSSLSTMQNTTKLRNILGNWWYQLLLATASQGCLEKTLGKTLTKLYLGKT